MKRLKHLLSLTTFLLLFALGSQAYADISSAALLYLRIAPGARAAGMGEAFVAIADDATATHWNPAGLGSSPLSTNWQNKNIPVYLQPITEMTTVKARGGSGHNQFDVWTISAVGLARFDNRKWFTYETFSTKTDETVAGIVKDYFNITDDEKLREIVAKVVATNSSRSFEAVEKFASEVLAAIPEEYSNKDELVQGFDSLKNNYLECRINWERYIEAENLFKDGLKDETFTEKEIDKLNFAIEKSRTRFIPEELNIKYSDLFTGELTTIKSIGSILLIGTENGFYTFDGRRWKTFTIEDGLPSLNILSISSVDSLAYIGTDKGLVKYSNKTLTKVELPEGVEGGAVTGIGSSSSLNMWVVINGELFNYNGSEWSNSNSYIAVLDDTYETIARKISIFKTEAEINLIAERIKSLNIGAVETDVSDETAVEELIDGKDSTSVDLTADAVLEEDSTLAEQTTDTVSDSLASDIVLGVEPQSVHIPTEFTIEPGKPVVVPHAIGIKGKINKIYSVGSKNVWIATDYGLYTYKDGEWKASGYQTISATVGQTLEDIATAYPHPLLTNDEYVSLIVDINNLDKDSELAADQSLKVFRNPLAFAVNDITPKGSGLYIATQKGLYDLKGTSLTKVDIGGMGDSNILNVRIQDDEIWFASDHKIAIKASGRTDISMMYAKWLPEFNLDLYYMFISGSTNIGGFGTVGANITYINYGVVEGRDEANESTVDFYPYDVALTLSYGGSLSDKLKGGVSAKLIYSQLSKVGTAAEQGTGTATGVALDFGVLWDVSNRFGVGCAITNLGPKISYIDAAQADYLPSNLALGFKVNLLNSEYNRAIFTAEVNKSLVAIQDGFSEEIRQLVINGGIEYSYSDLFAARFGYIWDDEGKVKTPTIGFGVTPMSKFVFDFAYIPSTTKTALSNTLRISMQILP